jgi:hypothetical protein
MRELRELAADAWYEVQTSVNDREPFFVAKRNVDLFKQVLYEAREIYGFVLRGLKFDGAWVSFYIKPDDGLQLPEIMQWVKQTFSVQFNVREGRTGHRWGTGTGRRLWRGRRTGRRSMCLCRWFAAGGRRGGESRWAVWEAVGTTAPRRAVRRGTRRADPGQG